ncbi:spore coat protein [Clostridium paridis]|uniref:Spore coat protein n=1 Tax=Clostridium paridis TaxID=2803863 RepID=A0A937K6D1_9CLOT|nr:spore coat protein [Clostridium paridis]MBL4933658.1 spore coat protein [Clostridium paridis]
MEDKYITPNEAIQIHELLTLKNLSLTKCVTMSPLVSDDELKRILKDDVATGKQHIKELSNLMEKSTIAQSQGL